MNIAWTSDHTPQALLFDDGQLTPRTIDAAPLTLSFDTAQRYCTGWHDLETGERHSCPDQAAIDAKYEQCPACQRRTGFNPAFYHAKSVSEQQDKRNHQPHYLYLAYFAPDHIKVGISFAGRGQSRLLEQGARAALVLETFPTALIARQYEADIARLDGIYEHLSARKKRALWASSYSTEAALQQLDAALKRVSSTLGVTFADTLFIDCDSAYFFTAPPPLDDVVSRNTDAMISGDVVGCIGTELIAKNDSRLLSLNLKKFIGYPVELSSTIEPISLPPQQASLF